MKKLFVVILLITGIVCRHSNFCFSQKNESETFTKLAPLHGKVVDKNGYGISMVMILVYGTPLGGISQSDGSFELQVPEDQLFGLLCWHPKYIQESFLVNTEIKSDFTIVLTECVSTIDFINKEFCHSQDKIEKNLPIPVVKLEDEIIPEFLGLNNFPEFPGGENGFWQRYENEMQKWADTDNDKTRLRGIYKGILFIGENGYMDLSHVDGSISANNRGALRNFFLSFGQWKPINWRGNVVEKEVRFVIKFD